MEAFQEISFSMAQKNCFQSHQVGANFLFFYLKEERPMSLEGASREKPPMHEKKCLTLEKKNHTVLFIKKLTLSFTLPVIEIVAKRNVK